MPLADFWRHQMDKADKPQFVAVITALAQGLGAKLSETQYQFYWAALEPLTIEQVEVYAIRLARECKFMPKPAEFFDLAKAEALLSWADSWEELITNHGETSDPIGRRALSALGGWRTVGFVHQDKLSYFADRFHELYETLATSTPVEERLLGNDTPRRLDGPRKLLS